MLPPVFDRVGADPMIRPEASRVTERTVPPACLCRSMAWTTRPEESRTTSRQVWAGAAMFNTNRATIHVKLAFMRVPSRGRHRLFG